MLGVRHVCNSSTALMFIRKLRQMKIKINIVEITDIKLNMITMNLRR
jgi:hypothetical protein